MESELQGSCCNCGDSKRKLYLIGSFGHVICGACARRYGLVKGRR